MLLHAIILALGCQTLSVSAETEASHRLSLEWLPQLRERLEILEEKLSDILMSTKAARPGIPVSKTAVVAESSEIRLTIGER